MDKREILKTDSVDSALGYIRSLQRPTPRLVVLTKELEQAQKKRIAVWSAQDLAKAERGVPKRVVANAIKTLHHQHLQRIVRDGRKLLAGYPGIEESLKPPLADAGAKDQVVAARRIAAAVRPHVKVFVKAQFPKNFLKEFERAIDAVESAAAVDPHSAIARYSEKTKDVKAFVKYARDLIQRVDAEVVALLHSDPTQGSLELWRKAKRVPKKMGRPKTSRKRPPPASSP